MTISQPDLWLLLILACAATWRVTYLLYWEVGPFKVVMHLRALTGVKHRDDVPIAYPDGNVFECFWCLSIWMALPVTLLMLSPWWPVLIPFALSAVAIQVQVRVAR